MLGLLGRGRRLFFALGMGVGAVALLASLAIFGTSLDGFVGEAFARLQGDGTRYAAGYTDAAFRRVRVGLSRDGVQSELGAPLQTSQLDSPKREVWSYSRQGEDDIGYRVRTIVFDGSVVVAKQTGFYID